MKKRDKKNCKSQVTIFVIVALIIVVSIALVFTLVRQNAGQISSTQDPRGYIQKCARDAATQIEKTILPNGGFASPSNYVTYKNNKVEYFCYTSQLDELCTSEHPMLNKEIEKQILNYVQPKLEQCFADVKAGFSQYDYKEGNLSFNIQISPESINLNIEKEITVAKQDGTITLNNFNTALQSPLYYFIKFSNDIVNQELNCNCGKEACNADILAMDRNNPNFEITKPLLSQKGEEVYEIKDIDSGKIFNFAVRNCVRQ